MKRSFLTIVALVSACALALAVPSLAPELTGSFPASAPATSASAAPTTPAVTTPATTQKVAATTTTTAAPSEAQSQGVVLISTQTTGGEAAGTGMVLSSTGEVLTNYHVVQGSTDVTVEVAATGTLYSATVVGHDAARDVALLQMKDASGLATITPDRDTVAVGDTLTAVGNASGGGTLVAAAGRVTALNQQVTVGNDNGGSETLTGVIQTTAGAVPGDSGGPMFDAQGEVVGMTTAGSQTVTRGPRGGRGGSTSGAAVTTVSYAVPIGDALSVVEQIRSGESSGTVRVGAKAYLGITVAPASDVLVNSVVADGPAADAGLSAGSVITSINGTAVVSQDELAAVLGQLRAGQSVKVAWTDASGARHSATVTLGSSPVN